MPRAGLKRPRAAPSTANKRAKGASRALAATQAEAAETFEAEIRESQAIVAPTEGSKAATVASAEDNDASDEGFDERFVDDFEGIDWSRLPRFQKPLRTLKQKKSWVFQHGYRVASCNNLSRTFFICKYCHQHKIMDATGVGVAEVTHATSSASAHLAINRTGHRITKAGVVQPALNNGQLTIAMAAKQGIEISQSVGNALGNFDFEQPAFRAMLTFANPEAEAALWRSHHSVSRFVLRLYDYMVPQVVQELSTAASKIHISFDGWTTKGGKRGFFGVVAHYATATGDVRDVAIDLPHLAGVHSGERIASCINQVLMKFGITSTTLGYFVLDNAYTNDAAVAKLSAMYNFSARQRRLRCAPHTLNLVGQSLIFGSNPDSYDNAFAEHNDEEHFMHEWREQGPLGVLLSIIKYIKTPQQYTLFETFQAHANAELPADER
ncbi:hypothetical protein Ptr902_08081 [Pyrenophora tritici-repentis]|nr:hypothetical protein Ptr902_08081 [Pyrenophora tritici-repentis]